MIRVTICRDASILESGAARSRLAASDLLVFPELVDGGYAELAGRRGRHRAGDPYLERFRLASDGPTVVAGSVALTGDGPTTNSTLVFRGGKEVFRYAKMHLFRPAGDRKYFREGKRAGMFTIRTGRTRLSVGVILCYDLRFPELVRGLALRGMQILVVPARWPKKRDRAWRTLLCARAIENQITVVGCNAAGPEGGRSYAFDPEGRCLCDASLGSGSGLRSITIDPNRYQRARHHHNNLRDAVLLRSPRRS